jgi:hypothetical protein
VTEMTPTSTGDTFIHSFWTDEDDDYQLWVYRRLKHYLLTFAYLYLISVNAH